MQSGAMNNSATDTAVESSPSALSRGRYIGRRIRSFFSEMQRRRVNKTVLSYAVLVWVMMQTGEVVFPTLGLPYWSLHLVVTVALLGLPIIIFLAWTFQITPRGIRIDNGTLTKTVELGGAQRKSASVDYAINLFLVLVGFVFAVMSLGEHTLAVRQHEHDAAAPYIASDSEQSAWVLAIALDPSGDRAGTNAFVRGIIEGERIPASPHSDPGDHHRRGLQPRARAAE